jgi:uroporphyrinogen-III synthase
MSLAGRRILVTRPRELAQGLAALVARAGGEAVPYPAIEIRDADDPAPARALLARLGDFDLAVFVSPSAVRKAFELLGRAWPEPVRAAAVGEGTRRELETRGLRQVIAPSGEADSEALLALPEMAAPRRVAILRGAGGRELLAETLAARGASVESVACYRRAPPEAPPPAGRLDAICVNSVEALQNLLALLGAERLAGAPLFVAHARIARRARELGLGEAQLAGPQDAQMLARLLAYFGGAK